MKKTNVVGLKTIKLPGQKNDKRRLRVIAEGKNAKDTKIITAKGETELTAKEYARVIKRNKLKVLNGITSNVTTTNYNDLDDKSKISVDELEITRTNAGIKKSSTIRNIVIAPTILSAISAGGIAYHFQSNKNLLGGLIALTAVGLATIGVTQYNVEVLYLDQGKALKRNNRSR